MLPLLLKGHICKEIYVPGDEAILKCYAYTDIDVVHCKEAPVWAFPDAFCCEAHCSQSSRRGKRRSRSREACRRRASLSAKESMVEGFIQTMISLRERRSDPLQTC